MKKYLNIFLLRAAVLGVVLLGLCSDVAAQCSQCKAAAAATDENGNLIATSLNSGVLYLLALPVFLPLLVGGIWWYLSRKRRMELEEARG